MKIPLLVTLSLMASTLGAAGQSPLDWPPPKPPALSETPASAEGLSNAVVVVVVDTEWIAAGYGQAGVELLDVRGGSDWAAGHIPHALPFEMDRLLPGSGPWPDLAEVRRLIGQHGPRPGDPVDPGATFVLYGEDEHDPWPSLGCLLLRAAGFDARLFPGGWRAWTAEPGRPVVRIATAGEVKSLLGKETEKVILLDLRGARDFSLDHLPEARSLPWERFTGEFEATVSQGWPGVDRATVPLVLYCYGKDCVRSRKGSTLAARLGFRNVLWFRGGILEWREAGYPLVEP
jgi:thiosulfate/3-mercaptopyruvate sulfurtransferase